jgi:hypothetical protein
MVEHTDSPEAADWRVREKERAAAMKNKKVKSVEVERSANGGFIARHRFDNSGPGPYKDSEEHTFGKNQDAEILSHLAEHLGLGGRKPAAKEEPSDDE